MSDLVKRNFYHLLTRLKTCCRNICSQSLSNDYYLHYHFRNQPPETTSGTGILEESVNQFHLRNHGKFSQHSRFDCHFNYLTGRFPGKHSSFTDYVHLCYCSIKYYGFSLSVQFLPFVLDSHSELTMFPTLLELLLVQKSFPLNRPMLWLLLWKLLVQF